MSEELLDWLDVEDEEGTSEEDKEWNAVLVEVFATKDEARRINMGKLHQAGQEKEQVTVSV